MSQSEMSKRSEAAQMVLYQTWWRAALSVLEKIQIRSLIKRREYLIERSPEEQNTTLKGFKRKTVSMYNSNRRETREEFIDYVACERVVIE